jgi:hypothetical protein
MSDMVAIATHLWPWEADILRSALGANGIYAVSIGQMDFTGGWSQITQVLVREEDLPEAREIRRLAESGDKSGQ